MYNFKASTTGFDSKKYIFQPQYSKGSMHQRWFKLDLGST